MHLFCHLVFQVNSGIFLFLLDLLLCENKCCGVGDTIITISRCDVATVRANQRIHKITVTGFVQRFVFVCLKSVTLLSSGWILVFYFFNKWVIFLHNTQKFKQSVRERMWNSWVWDIQSWRYWNLASVSAVENSGLGSLWMKAMAPAMSQLHLLPKVGF